jgi:hypothetical protein
MSNWNIISPYKRDDAKWLRERGYPRPRAWRGNSMPTTADMKWALESFDTFEFEYPSGEQELRVDAESGGLIDIRGFDWDAPTSIPGDHFVIQGELGMLQLLIKLCERCGQLYLYPDTGDPPIVLDASLDPAAVYELWTEANEQDPDKQWTFFFEEMYGS